MYRITTNGKKLHRNVPDREQAAWIMYRMKIAGYTQISIAKSAECTSTMVRSVIYGKKTSPRIRIAICRALGFSNWSDLISESRRVAA